MGLLTGVMSPVGETSPLVIKSWADASNRTGEDPMSGSEMEKWSWGPSGGEDTAERVTGGFSISVKGVGELVE